MVAPLPVHRALLSVDIEGSGRSEGDNTSSVALRKILYTELEQAFESSGIDWSACVKQDTGDGVVVLVPPEFPKRNLIHPLLGQLADGLRHHNRYASTATRIRVRVAVHAGDVLVDDYGTTGRPQVLLARLLAARPLREALAGAPDSATVAVLVSDGFYHDVVAQGHRGIDPDLFTAVTVREKETEARAWLHVIGHAGQFRNSAEKEPKPAPTGGINFTGSQVEVHGDVFTGDKYPR